jgi:curved DNA-binding protein CbpA
VAFDADTGRLDVAHWRHDKRRRDHPPADHRPQRLPGLRHQDRREGRTDLHHLQGRGPDRTYKVRIPAGLKDGQEVRIRELGGPGKNGGAPGDAYVTVHVVD